MRELLRSLVELLLRIIQERSSIGEICRTASYQRAAGVPSIAVTKTGGDQPQGSVFEILLKNGTRVRNEVVLHLDLIISRFKQVLRLNGFGRSYPRDGMACQLNDGRSHAFFFSCHEVWRWTDTEPPRLSALATPEWRNGPFSPMSAGRVNILFGGMTFDDGAGR